MVDFGDKRETNEWLSRVTSSQSIAVAARSAARSLALGQKWDSERPAKIAEMQLLLAFRGLSIGVAASKTASPELIDSAVSTTFGKPRAGNPSVDLMLDLVGNAHPTSTAPIQGCVLSSSHLLASSIRRKSRAYGKGIYGSGPYGGGLDTVESPETMPDGWQPGSLDRRELEAAAEDFRSVEAVGATTELFNLPLWQTPPPRAA